jgi:DNA invertase Pin-like site-specific DNA recombinase
MTIFAYGRTSTLTQNPDNQLLEIKNAGYNVNDDTWFVDGGISGRTQIASRPQFQKLKSMANENDIIVVSKLDRLGRNAIDILHTIQEFQERKIKVVVIQLGNTDITSPIGKMLLMMLSALAEIEHNTMIERTQAGLQRAKAEGKKLGRPSKTTSEQRSEIVEKIERGLSISSIAREYNISRASVIEIRKTI